MNKLDNRVLQILKEEDEKENSPSFGVSDDDSSTDDKTDDANKKAEDNSENKDDSNGENDVSDDKSEDTDNEKDTDEEEEKQPIETYDDFLKDTESKCTVKLISTEPSPIFGPKDTQDHNKYRVTISNKKGSVWFYF